MCKDHPTAAEIEERQNILFAEKPIVSLADLTAKAQDLLEESAFKKVSREEPEFLEERGVTVHEQVEMNE